VTDFVGLCRAARELPGPDTHERLWRAWFDLPQWHFISAPSPVGPLPYSNFVNGHRDVFAFTTNHNAYVFSARHRAGPLMTLTPEAMLHRVAQLRAFGVFGFLVDVGPDGFHTSLDNLWAMFHRFKAPPAPAPVHTPAVPRGPVQGTLEWFKSLPTWQLVVTKADKSVPELASEGGDLIAQVYSTPLAVACAGVGSPVAMMTPKQVIDLLVGMELVKFVRFDGQLTVDVVDVATG
jgi:hypothetical protein